MSLRVRVQAPDHHVLIGDPVYGPCVEEVIGKIVDTVIHTSRDFDLIIEIRDCWEKYVKGNWLPDDYEESGDDLLCGELVARTTLIFRPDHSKGEEDNVRA